MVRKRLAIDEKTNKNQNRDNGSFADDNDFNKYSSINGYKKFIRLIFLFIAVIIIRKNWIDSLNVIGNSMCDSFVQGDMVLVKKYGLNDIKRFDVVIADMNGQNVIKRVIGLPNDVIQIKDGFVYLNDKKIDKDFDFFTENPGCVKEPYVLNENDYFLMGDNRNESFDSRYYGAVDFDDIKGIVIMRFYPLDRFEIFDKK